MSISGEGRVGGWVGWVWFAAIMLVLIGFFNAIDGLVAIFKDEYFVVGPRGGLLLFDLTAWGWIHLITGILQVLVGIGLIWSGSLWIRIAAICLAGFNAIAQLTFLSAYPIWSVLLISLDVLVIWALTVHGDEVQAAASRG